MMVNFNNLMTTTPASTKGAAASTDTQAPISGFAALFAALSNHSGSQSGVNTYSFDATTTEAQLQQLANNLKPSEQEQLLEQAELNPEAIAQILAQLQQQQALQQPQSAQSVANKPSVQAVVANAVSAAQPQRQPVATNQISPVITDEPSTTTASAPVSNNAVSTKPVEQLAASVPVATPEPEQAKPDIRGSSAPLTTELNSVKPTTQLETTRTVQAPVSTMSASVVMVEAPVAQSVQSAQTAPTTPSTTAATASLTAPVGSQAWANQLQQNVMQMVMHNQNEMTLRLHPAELGPLQVQLRMDDNTAQLNILTHSQQVRGALEQAMSTLRDALANQGIQLGESQVSDQGQQFAQQQARQQAQQWAANSQNNGQNTNESTVENSESAENTDMGSNSRHTAAAHNGQVDTFA
ncbi:flagellar hook-length control protein FliK [Pseudidiomarina marina]|uniref:flagellar hook-length control protein FliK n=1 Tax=Pseudidiomarina marina TaxID=502366 RepID=UPI00384A698E